MRNKNFWLLSIILLIVPFLVTAMPFVASNRDWSVLHMGDPIDQGDIADGLRATDSVADTLSWWSGTWVQGDSHPFFRPLTSTLWWFEYRMFGENPFLFIITHLAFHFGVCLLVVGLVRRLIDERTALITGAVWAGGLTQYLTLPSNVDALGWWRDSADVWVSGSILLSLFALLSYVRTSEKRYLFAAFSAQILAILFKEMAYVIPLLAALILWYERRLNLWKIPVAMTGVTVAAYAYRYWALGGPGFAFGTNGSWLERFVLYAIGGRPANMAVQGQFAALAIAVLLFGLYLLTKQNRRTGLTLVCAGVAGIGVSEASAPGEMVARLISPLVAEFPLYAFNLHYDIIVALVLMSAGYAFIVNRDRRAGFAFGWVLLAYMPLLKQTVTAHGLYLMSIGWAILVALAVQMVFNRVRHSLPHSTKTETASMPVPLR